MSRPVIQLDPEKTDYATLVKRLAILAGLEITDADGRLLVQRLPEKVDARVSVINGTATELDGIVLFDGEIALEKEAGKPVRLRAGDGEKPGGFLLQAEEAGTNLHSPGTLTFLNRNTAQPVRFSCQTTAGQYSVLWWDGTITSHNSDAVAAKDEDSPAAAWVNSPKLIRVFPAAAGENITQIRFGQVAQTNEMILDAWEMAGVPLLTISNITFNWTGRINRFPKPPATLQNLILSGTDILSKTINLSGLTMGTLAINDCGLERIRAVDLFDGDLLDGLEMDEWDFSNNDLSAAALNQLFSELKTRTNTETELSLVVAGNPGAATCDPSIATAKGYGVITV